MIDPLGLRLRSCAQVEASWLTLRARLWPEVGEADQRFEAQAIVDASGRQVAIVAEFAGRAVGFAEASLRFEYVNGTRGSPVAFLEGLYVDPEQRGRGVARRLVEAIADWARSRGCSELASDTLLDNAAGMLAHRSLGFEESQRVVFFRKDLSD